VEKFSIQKAARGGSILDAHFAPGWVNFRCSFPSGVHHISRRGVEEIVETVFEVPTSLGTIVALEAETTAALDSAYQEVQSTVRNAHFQKQFRHFWVKTSQV